MAERPSREFPFSPADGHRYTAAGVPVCVHPEKVGMPPGSYATDGAPLVPELRLPNDITDLDHYLRGLMHSAAPGVLEQLIDQAVQQIPQAFPEVDVVQVLRRALG